MTVTLANQWAAKGWDVTIVTLAGADEDFYQLNPAVKRIPLDMAGDSRNLFAAVINNIRRLGALCSILRRQRPDVAISMMPAANVILAVAGCLARVPVVGSERIHPPTMPLGRAWETARKYAYPLLSGLVAQTEDSASWLRRHAPAPNIVVIPNPIEYPISDQAPRILPAGVFAKLAGEHTLLAVGRLVEQKGFDRLLTAFADLAQQYSDWSLVILGEGGRREELMEQAASLGLEGRAAFPGAVGNVGDWFSAADAYVMTSRFEGFPNTLLEALACGVPSLAVDCMTGPRELIETGVNGLLVPQNDPVALVEGLKRLMGDADLRAQLAKRAVAARETFAVVRIAGRWEELFQNLLDTARVG